MHLSVEEVDRQTELRVHRRATMVANERVRILVLRQGDHTHRRLVPEQLQTGAEGRLLPGLIAVVEQEDFGRIAYE